MKAILSLWAILSLFCFCKTMDRHRNKMCYTAMTCVHTGRERCGVDGSGNHRRFYDSCDILEYNCLKGKDYVKTTTEKCRSLPLIDVPQQEKGSDNNVVNTGNSNGDEEAIEGTMTINDNGDVEGEVIMNKDNIMEQSPNNEKDMVDDAGLDQENTGVEGEIQLDDEGGVEGELQIDDAGAVGDNLTIDETGTNQGAAGFNGKIAVDEEENIEGEIELDDEQGASR